MEATSPNPLRVPAARALLASSVLLLALTAAVAPRPALAQAGPDPEAGDGETTRMVLYPFDGPRRTALRARDVVEQAIGESVMLVSAEEIRAAIRDFEIDLDREDAHLELATVVAAPMVFMGEVTRDGTELVVVDANGEPLGTRTAPSPRSPAGRQGIADAARELVVEASLMLEQRRAAQLEAARQAQVEAARQAEIDQELLEEMGVAGDEEEALDDIPRYPMLQALVGLTFRNRNVTIAREGLMGQPAVDAAYEIGLFPELTLRVEARPLVASGPIPGGFVLWFDGGIGFGVRTETEGPESQELDTTVFHVEGGAGYLYPIDVFQVGVNVALGFDAYQLAANDILPTTNYGYLRVGLDGRLTILRGAVEPRVFLGYRIVVGANDDFTDRFGSESTLGGLDVGAGVGGVMLGGLTYLLAFEYVRWNLSFSGDPAEEGVLTRGLDGSDDGIRIRLQAGWSF